jgi:hypothetical protein
VPHGATMYKWTEKDGTDFAFEIFPLSRPEKRHIISDMSHPPRSGSGSPRRTITVRRLVPQRCAC